MTLARINLFLFGSVFLAVGLWFLVDPVGGAASVGITLSNPLGISDLRAVYGGLDLSAGLLLVYSGLRGEYLNGLQIQTFIFGGLLLGRLFGLALDHPDDSLVIILLTIEGLGFLGGLAGLKQLGNTSAS